MKIFDQTNNNKSKFRHKGAALLMMCLSSLSVFASDGSGVSDTSLTWILLGMIVAQIAILYVISGVFKSLTGNSGIWKKLIAKSNPTIITGIFVLMSTGAFAQDAGSSFVLDSSLESLLIAVNAFLLVVIVVLLVNVKKITNALKGGEEDLVAEDDMFSSLGLTDAVPIEREEEILLDHDYDGIHELDNNLPPWWLYGFYFTVISMTGYMYYYLFQVDSHVGHNEYVAEMQLAAEEAELRGASVDENSVTLLTSAADIAAGKKIYDNNCIACHLASGGGSVGPNLTDEYWKHGGSVKDVFRTIKVGVPEKGMISWESQLSPTDIQKVTSFVLSLQGTNPADGKAPEGDKYTGE
ncbi:MAG: cbb3-type cytochrome c oxidase N-terminal domain-containing protein [Salibacteraceae bacterium]